MSGSPKPHPTSGWLAPAAVVLFALQLGLLYIQGAQLHRQRGDIRALREDVQVLTETLDQAMTYEEGAFTPRYPVHRRLRPGAPGFKRVILEEGPEPAIKELEAARQDAQKAVEKVQDTQQKLSIEENARKADEKAKVQATQASWGRYVAMAFVLALVAIFVRSFLRERA